MRRKVTRVLWEVCVVDTNIPKEALNGAYKYLKALVHQLPAKARGRKLAQARRLLRYETAPSASPPSQ